MSSLPRPRRRAVVGLAPLALALLAGCGSAASLATSGRIPRALLREARPIGTGPRFQPPVRGPLIGRCTMRPGVRSGVHVELFAANRVVLLPAGIGTAGPRKVLDGQISAARCYGELVTLAPTGVVLVRAGAQLTLAALFRSWGEPLSRSRLASFSASAGRHVTVFVDGRRWLGLPSAVPLTRHAEIVLEVGPYVPPHRSFTFPPGI